MFIWYVYKNCFYELFKAHQKLLSPLDGGSETVRNGLVKELKPVLFERVELSWRMRARRVRTQAAEKAHAQDPRRFDAHTAISTRRHVRPHVHRAFASRLTTKGSTNIVVGWNIFRKLCLRRNCCYVYLCFYVMMWTLEWMEWSEYAMRVTQGETNSGHTSKALARTHKIKTRLRYIQNLLLCVNKNTIMKYTAHLHSERPSVFL